MSWKKKIVLALIPAVLLFGVLEIACLVWERFDPPMTSLLRNAEPLPAKEPNEFRVLLYGGSTVAGDPDPSVGFAAQLQHYLRQIVPEKDIVLITYAAAGQPTAYTVRVMFKTVEASEADALLVLAAHNEFLMIEDMSREDIASLYSIQESMHRSALIRRLRRVYYRYVTARRMDLISGDNLSSFDRNSARFEERTDFFESNMDSIVEIAERSGIPLFLCTGPCNIADWAPANEIHSIHSQDEGYREAVNRARDLLEEGEAADALEFCEAALQRIPGDAVLTYQLGRAHFELGQFDEAREMLYRARDQDAIPFRVLGRFNETIRSKHDPPRVHVVDLAELFDARSPHGITGFELIADNCHPTPAGGFLIATALIDEFGEAGLIESGGVAEEQLSLEAYLQAAGFEERKADYYLAVARTAMKAPFHNWTVAELNLNLAREAGPDRWEVLANLAAAFFMKNEVEEAKRYLARAVEQKGSEIDPDDRVEVPFLKEAMEHAGFRPGK